MSDLLREIRSAQIRAGEGAVCDHLCKLGLIAEKVADVQRPLNALKIADALRDGACPSYVRLDAAEMIRQQHAEIDRMKADADRVNSCAKNLAIAMHRKNFSNITQWEPLPDTMGLISQIDNMSCWHDAEIDRLKRERHHIYDLLARIHRDGGQYTAEQGVEKSCDDAEAQVVTWLDTISGVDALIEQARIAEREECAVVCDDLGRMVPGTKSSSMLHFAAKRIRARSAK